MWKSFEECFRGCGRNAWLFMVALFTVLPMLLLINELQAYVPHFLGGVGVLIAAWIGVVIYRNRADRRKTERLPPLSRDELRVARSKLTKDTNRKRP